MFIATVSSALNGYSDVNAETRKRVPVVGEMLAYRPSYTAAILRRNETRTITFMASKPWTRFVDPFFLGVLDGPELALSAEGYDLQVVLAREFATEFKVIRKIRPAVRQGSPRYPPFQNRLKNRLNSQNHVGLRLLGCQKLQIFQLFRMAPQRR